MTNEDVSVPSVPETAGEAKKTRPGPLLASLTVSTFLLTGFLAFTIGQAEPRGGLSYSLGYVTGSVIFFPAIITGLFMLGKRFRNARSMTKICLWTLVVSLFVQIITLGSTLSVV